MPKRRKQAQTEAPQVEPKRVTPVDIQQKEFRLAMRGYNERDVDQFLDEVTEELARLYADNKRLREEVEFGKTTRLDTGGAGEAEGVIRQAKEEAARIIAEATARASTIGATDTAGHLGEGTDTASGAPPHEIMGIFLARERAFLQNMANLIQAHAEGVKQDVRRVREQVARDVPPAPSPAERPPAAAEPGEPEQPEESGFAGSSPEEPTRAWASTTEGPRADAQASGQDIVDLTEQPEHPAEEPSRVHERTPGGNDRREAGGQDETTIRASAAPRVEDDDAREDRSIRELFWGED
ncbi:MAG TPA: DivIVA domain-containing protein [Actinomycetota bacterium]|nr:DivIVA domain-containing protein [Actinomycetota bacterium]